MKVTTKSFDKGVGGAYPPDRFGVVGQWVYAGRVAYIRQLHLRIWFILEEVPEGYLGKPLFAMGFIRFSR